MFTVYRSAASKYFNNTVLMGSCNLFTALNFTLIGGNWSSHFNTCAYDANLFLNILLKGRAHRDLLSTQCLKYDSNSTSTGNCSCQMDCLLQFELGAYSYIFLEGIDCNQTVFNSAINIYRTSASLWSKKHI